jgi:hypothetical protein
MADAPVRGAETLEAPFAPSPVEALLHSSLEFAYS